MAGRRSKGSQPSVPKNIRINADLLREIEAVLATDGGTFIGFLEDGARLKLEQRDRDKRQEPVA
jgi:hypothetical protein